MKKVKFALLMLITAMIVLPSCKKGPDDPFISLKSRNGRLIKTWNLTKIEGKVDNDAVAYDGSNVTFISTTFYKNATYEMTFDKDGVFSYTETETANISGAKPTTTTEKGYWSWGNADKNKDFLMCNATPFGKGTSSGYYVDGLKSSTLILKYYNETPSSLTDITLTFEKK